MTNSILQEDIKEIVDAKLPWNMLSGATILISGASGFIASYLVRSLLYLNTAYKKNITVLAIVRSKKRAEDKFFEYLGRKDFHILVQDVSEPPKYSGKIDFIIHAASHASPKYYGRDPVGIIMPNILGTMNMLELGRSHKVQSFLFFSSGEVYGVFEKPSVIISESDYGSLDPTNVRSCYAESKRMGENLCVSWFIQHHVPIKIVRPFHVYGPGMAMDDGRVQADFVSNVVNGEDIVMKSDGKNYRTFCYISDAVRAFFTVLLKGKNGEAYNVGNDTAEIQISKLASLLANRISGGNIRVIRKDREKSEHYMESPIERCRPNIEKMKSLGWKPRYSLEEGFRRTIESYRV